jgi:hypothetical protein
MCVFESVGVCMSSGPLACALRAQRRKPRITEKEARSFFIGTTGVK